MYHIHAYTKWPEKSRADGEARSIEDAPLASRTGLKGATQLRTHLLCLGNRGGGGGGGGGGRNLAFKGLASSGHKWFRV